MDPAEVLREIDQLRCMIHEAFGTDSRTAQAGLDLYRAACREKQMFEEHEKGQYDART